MIILDSDNISKLIKNWFSKSIYVCDFTFPSEIKLENLLNIFLSDYQRYYPDSDKIEINNIIKRAELQGILLYRLAHVFYLDKNEYAAELCSNLGRFLSGFEIYYSAEIGNGLKINHGLGTVIGARTKIGDNVLIHQGVTFGDRNGGRPVIKDNVIIYAGAKILGNIEICENVIIGANSVCLISIPKNKTVVGVPAKIIN